MEILIGLLVAAFGGVFFFKNKADKAAVDAKFATLKAKDEDLKKRQGELDELIGIVDEGIKLAEEKKAAAKDKRKNMSLIERRELSSKRFGKK